VDLVGADIAHERGFTGRGITVAVIDSGIDVTHPEFAGRIAALSRDFGIETDAAPLFDRNGHGTHVAGIIGAARNGVGMMGIAFDATILALRSVGVEEDPDADSASNLALYYAAAQKVGVINGSYGPNVPVAREIPDPSDPESSIPNPNYTVVPQHIIIANGLEQEFNAVTAAANADVVMVFAAGNEYLDQPIFSSNPSGIGLFPYIRPENHGNGTYAFVQADENFDLNDPSTWTVIDPADPALADVDLSSLAGTLITVVATDRNGQIASYSNRCGVAALWCLAAPGGETVQAGENPALVAIPSTYPGQTYENLQGTSMATPVVSGGAAILRQAFPYLTARQIIEVILTTADDMGSPEIYGHGMLNVGRAINGPAEFGATGFASVFDVDTKGHDSVWRGNIAGAGGLMKRGDGTLSLLGNNTYAGGTEIDGGTLLLGGTVASSVTVGRSGRLVGAGTIGADLLADGIVDPGTGAAPGTLTVDGDARLSASSTLAIALRGSLNDQVAVGGVTQLEGGALSIALEGGHATLSQSLAVLTAGGGVSGTFGSLTTNSRSFFLDPNLTYGNAVTLTFARNATSFESVATNQNARSVARLLDGSGQTAAVAGFLASETAAGAASALTVLSGEIHAAARTVLVDQTRHLRDAAQARIQAAFAPDGTGRVASFCPNGAEAIAANQPDGLAVWARGTGASGRIDGDGGGSTIDHSLGGILIGADYGVTPDARLGAILGYGRSQFDIGAAGEGEADHFNVALYGGAALDAIKISGGVGYGLHSIETTRALSFGGFSDRLTAEYDAHSLQAFADVGYDLQFGTTTVQPFVNVAHAMLDTDGFSEQGGAAALAGRSATTNTTWTTLGARIALPVAAPAAFGNTTIGVNAMAGWRHAFGDTASVTTLAFAGVAGFAVQSASAARDAAVVELGVDIAVDRLTQVGVSYSGVLASGAQDSSVSLKLSRGF
jgi:subtilase-type serine protease